MRNRRGSLLVGIVFSMLIMSLMAVTGVSMLVNQSKIALNVQSIAQSHALAEGASRYVLRQLGDDVDWSDGTTLESDELGGYPFLVTWANQSRNSIRVNVTSQISVGSSISAHNYSFTVWRAPAAAQFALFWANEDNQALALNNVHLKGPVYMGGNAEMSGGSQSAGYYFYKEGASIPTGVVDDVSAASGTGREVADPQPVLPAYDVNASNNRYENAVVNVYNPDIVTAHSTAGGDTDCPTTNSDLIIPGNKTISGVVTCRDIYVTAGTDITLSGTGKLIAWRNIYFQTPPVMAPNSCTYNDGAFRSSDGGCKKILNPGGNLVWSQQLSDNMQAMAVNACSTGLYAGWALPTQAQLEGARQGGAVGHLAFAPGEPLTGDGNRFWTSTPGGAGGSFKTVDMATLGATAVDRNGTSPSKVLCVKTASSSNLGTTTIQPSGGPIEIIAGGNVIKSDDRKGLKIKQGGYANERVTLYAANATIAGLAGLPQNPLSQTFFSSGTYGPLTEFDQPRIISSRNVRFGAGATVVNDGIVYVRSFSSVANERNVLEVTEGSIIDGSVLSVSLRDPSLRLDGSTVRGILYVRGTSTQGRAEIANSVVLGAAMINSFSGNTIANSTLDNRDATNYPTSNMPDGFSSSVSIQPLSWDGM